MTLPPCPACHRVPDVSRVLVNGISFKAECDCVQIFAWPMRSLENAWKEYSFDPEAFINSCTVGDDLEEDE